MIELSLFKIRAFSAGNLAGFAIAMARGGLQPDPVLAGN
jgi:hypothetical protein